MSLFERVSLLARAEATYKKNQSDDPLDEINHIIGTFQDAVIKTRLLVAQTPTEQAEGQKRRLAGLEDELAKMRAKRDEFLTRIKNARTNTDNSIKPIESRFQPVDETVLKDDDMEPQFTKLLDNSDVEGRLRKIEGKLETMKAQLNKQQNQLNEQQKMTNQLLNQNSIVLEEVRSLLLLVKPCFQTADNSMGDSVEDELEVLRKQIDDL